METKTEIVALIGNEGVGKTTVFERFVRGRISKRRINDSRIEVQEALLPPEEGSAHRCSGGASLCAKLRRSDSISSGNNINPRLLVDAPGTAMIFGSGSNEDAMAFLLLHDEVDKMLFVADAKKLRRSLVTFLQAIEFGLPSVFILNMMDEASSKGLAFDVQSLSAALGTDVVEMVATEKGNFAPIGSLLDHSIAPQVKITYPRNIEKAAEALCCVLSSCKISKRALSLMLLSGNRIAEQFLEENFDAETIASVKEILREVRESFGTPLDVLMANVANSQAEKLVQFTSVETTKEQNIPERLGKWTSHPFYGALIAVSVLLIGYIWVGVVGATVVVDYIDDGLFRATLLPAIEHMIGLFPLGVVGDIIIDPDFGLVPSAIFLALGIVFPVLFFFYIFLGFLEESGYLPRLSVLMDKSFRVFGLDGRGVFPLVFGLSCVTTAILTTRILKSKKQQIIASFLLLLSYPCAPLLTVMLIVLAPLPWTAAALLFGCLTIQTLVAGIVVNRVMPGTMPDFIMELPPFRFPRPKGVILRSFRKSVEFLKEAMPIFMLASFVLFVLNMLGALTALENLSRPVVNGLLGLPDQSVQIFIKTIVRRESGAADLAVAKEHFTGVQLVITMFVMTVLVPCVNTIIVLFKELGVRLSLFFLGIVTVYALGTGTVLNYMCQLFKVSFS